jgi:Peptidase family M48
VAVLGSDRVLLTVTLFGAVLWLIRKTIGFAKGGLGVRITAPFWGSYWREREHTADQYAAQLGQAEELAEFLEIHALIHDHPVPLIWLTEHTHPPTELRIDKLRKAAFRVGAVAPGSEPVKAAPTGPPTAGPDGPALTEPDPSADRLSGRQG